MSLVAGLAVAGAIAIPSVAYAGEKISLGTLRDVPQLRVKVDILSVQIMFRAPVTPELLDRVVETEGPTIGILVTTPGVGRAIALSVESLDLTPWEGEGIGDLRFRFAFRGPDARSIEVYAGPDGAVFCQGRWYRDASGGKWLRKVWRLLADEISECSTNPSSRCIK
jgi:hypothetical protein